VDSFIRSDGGGGGGGCCGGTEERYMIEH